MSSVIVKEAQLGLDLLRVSTIGVIIRRGIISMVQEYNELTNEVVVVDVTPLGYVQETTLTINISKVHLFPNNKNMLEMLENPLAMYNFIKGKQETNIVTF